ncbi:hypothetical protein [Desulfonatronovibrio hydrogenovorans]|uniref:hypothetical protein n=1 Tax=Desulfonatronovibrio hydrogenovorans TaxID=53245 RepID=UPI00048F6298|nr:hypothetical protein [Desulfonatronovibrio hydrogenovorans]
MNVQGVYYKAFSSLSSTVFFGVRLKNYLRTKKSADLLELIHSYYEYEARVLNLNYEICKSKIVQITDGRTAFNFSGSYTDFDGKPTMILAGDKEYSYSVMDKNNIPVPRHQFIKNGDFRSALAFRKNPEELVVIKPARDTGDSTGVFVGLKNTAEIVISMFKAGLYGKDVLVEEFVHGTNYRLLFFKGKLLSACSRIPARVVGDGNSTISQLIDQTNFGRMEQGVVVRYRPDSRPLRYKIKIDQQLKETIARQGFKLDSVPEKDVIVHLQNICHWLKGGEYYDVSDRIAPEIIQTCAKAVACLGVKLAGVDVIAQDISDPCKGYVINEVNTTPCLLVHYEVQNRDMVKPVLNFILMDTFGLS